MNTIMTFLHKQSFLIVIIIFAIFYLPIPPNMPRNGLDPSWLMAIAYGLANNLKFGQNMVVNYGPLGAAYTSVYWPGIFHWAFIYWTLVLIGFTLAVKTVLNKQSVLTQLSVLSPLLFICVTDSFLFIVFFLIVISASTIGNNWWQSAFIATILGLIGLSKLTFFVAGLVTLLPLAITLIVKQHGFIKQMLWLIYFITWISGWLLLGQNLDGIPTFFVNSWYMVSGHNSMEIIGPWSELVFGTIILFILGFQIIFRFSYPNKPGDVIENKLIAIAQIFALLFISWLAFKQGFVRHDGHVLAFVSFSGAAIGVIFLTNSQSETKFTNGIVYIAIILWFLFYSETTHYHKTTIWQGVYQDVIRRWNALQSNGINFSIMENTFFNSLNSIKLNNPLPKVAGTVDINTNISRILGNGLNWQPRPVIQSYSVYTPELAALNGQHMESSATAPQHFFAEIGAIDGRMAMQQDPLLWTQLLVNYKLETANKILQGNILHLSRNLNAYEFIKQDFTLTEKDGYWIIPSNIQYNFLTLSAMPKLSVLDKAIAFLFKPREIFIESALVNGEKSKHKFILSLKDTPFIFSPLIKNTVDFISTRHDQRLYNPKKVVAFRFMDANGNTVLTVNTPKIQIYKFTSETLDTISCIGNIDSINGNTLPKQFSIADKLEVRGWLAQSQTQILPSAPLLVLTNNRGENTFFKTQAKNRPDIVKHFNNPDFNSVGFVSIANVSYMTGNYVIGLGFTEGENIKICRQFKIPGTITKN